MKLNDVVLVKRMPGDHPRNYNILNKIGVVRSTSRSSLGTIGVEFPEMFDGGHDLSGGCQMGRGWWVETRCLEKMEPISVIVKRQQEEKK